MAGGMDGFYALGDMLAGGPKQRAEDEYVGQYRKNAQAADAMWKARDQRARAIAREGLKPELFVQAGVPQNQAPLASALMTTAATPNLRNAGLPLLGDMELDRQIQDHMAKGEFDRANQLTAVKADKNYEPVRVAGGNMMPSGVALGDADFEVVPLPQTLATIEQKEAQIRQGDRRTDATVARANRAPAARGGGGKAPSAASAESAVLQQARDAIAAGASVEAVKKRLKDRGYGKLAGRL